MSDSDLRPIEELLKAAAARRRDQAGKPEIHRATREILRTEVQRHYGAGRRTSRGRVRWVLNLLPKLAVFAALGVCAWLVFHDGRSSSPMELALEDREVAVAEETERADSMESESQRVTSEKQVLADADTRLSLPAPRLEPMSTPSAAPVREQTPDLKEKSVVGVDYLRSDRTGMYMGTAAAEAAATESGGVQDGVAMSALVDTGSTTIVAGRPLKESVSPAVVQGIVLQEFTVLNENNVVRLIDSDGSTYEGMMEPVEDVAAAAQPVRASGYKAGGARDRFGETPDLASPNLRNFSVVASGTNRSLGQTVQFKGELSLTETQVQEGRNMFSNTVLLDSRSPAVAGALARNPSEAGRLQGRAVLDDGNDVRINAVRAGP